MLLLSTFQKNCFRNTIKMSNSLDPDQDRHFVGPDLGPSCLQRLSADFKMSPLTRKELPAVFVSPAVSLFHEVIVLIVIVV